MTDECKSCRFFLDQSRSGSRIVFTSPRDYSVETCVYEGGVCRRYPPAAAEAVVAPRQWCGEYERVKEKE